MIEVRHRQWPSEAQEAVQQAGAVGAAGDSHEDAFAGYEPGALDSRLDCLKHIHNGGLYAPQPRRPAEAPAGGGML